MNMMKVDTNILDALPASQPQKKSTGDSSVGDFFAHLDKAANTTPKDRPISKPANGGKNTKDMDSDMEEAGKADGANGNEAVVIAQVPIMVDAEQMPEPVVELAALGVETAAATEAAPETAAVEQPVVELLIPGEAVQDEGEAAVKMPAMAIPEGQAVAAPQTETLEGEAIKQFNAAAPVAEEVAPTVVAGGGEEAKAEPVAVKAEEVKPDATKNDAAPVLRQADEAGQPKADAAPVKERAVEQKAAPEAKISETVQNSLQAAQNVQPQENAAAQNAQAGQNIQAVQKAVESTLSEMEDLDPEAAQFMRQVLGEAETAVKEDKGFTMPTLNNAGTEEAENTGQQKSGAEQQDGMGKQQKETVKQPVTAHIAQDGRVEFNMAPREVQPQAPVQQSYSARDVQFQIIEQVRTMVSESRSEFVLQLKPEHLGGLTIMLASEKDGIVAKMLTANKDVHVMMQAEMGKIQESLKERGINVVQMEVVYDQMAGAAGKQDTNSGQGWEQGSGSFSGKAQTAAQESAEGMAITYEEMSSYDVLAEQGGSVEFTA